MHPIGEYARTMRQRAHELLEESRATLKAHPRAAMWASLSSLAIVLISIIAAAWYVHGLLRSLPDDAAIAQIGQMDQATAVFDDADQLAFTIYKEQRIDVPLNQISPNLVHAIVAIEDQRFYEHHGFDWRRIVSAALINVRHGRVAQGGSTITQQLARQSFLTPDKTLRRKLQELVLAWRI